jgi:hypothetical protein
MVSNLRNLIKAIAGAKEMEIADYQERELALIEKHLDSGQIDIEAAVGQIREMFSFHFSGEDYRKINKELEFRK